MNVEDLENTENSEEYMDDDTFGPGEEVEWSSESDELHTVVQLSGMYQDWFLEYASYVILERAVPHVNDGLKPVQRRILHSMKRLDDGRYNKVANIIGHTMQVHPHGDASIYSALVVLANKDLFIDKQGNFGNEFTGDEASAARYIECRILPLAKQILYNPELTEFEDSYDGRNREPVTFPAKVPVLLVQGAEGIAVGMSTRILPHNFVEVMDAVTAALRGDTFELFPDFSTGGLVDVTDYEDGLGKVLVRAQLDTKDKKKIVVRELPYGSTTESLIASIEGAAKKNKIKIAGISDYTTEKVEIEIKLARGIHTNDMLDAPYAFTDCEKSISVNLLIIKDKKPVQMTVTEVIEYHAKRLVEILTKELKLEEGHLRDRLHERTLEQIFIEERIYKRIEEMETHDAVITAVLDGFKPFHKKIKRKVTPQDVEKLLKIPIRRISLYDINKAKKEMSEIKSRLRKIKGYLANITDYAVGFLSDIIKQEKKKHQRRTEITSFAKTDIREAAQRNLALRYDSGTGYLGYQVSGGKALFDVSIYDRILIIRKSGTYSVINAPEKVFIDKGMWYCGLADKEKLAETVFSVVYRDKNSGQGYIKRCRIEQYILDKGYTIVPEKSVILKLTDKQNQELEVVYKPKPHVRILEETFDTESFLVKSVRAQGVRLSTREIKSAKFGKKKK